MLFYESEVPPNIGGAFASTVISSGRLIGEWAGRRWVVLLQALEQ